ncbi:hypothetical protein NX02_29215 [Sphingomonas sanxanigenens DSM 19645 = NX02]|uniref:HTH cro/C1-type domain-containing protein n=2 Tax=Sphingomonas sanxanigenens TaxID=397260 RepID=W0AJU4_9SPHN|nr:hypothetical protein NX02_29215 [Sphingomonas sanxanigenens DSM 19645 = NX02]
MEQLASMIEPTTHFTTIAKLERSQRAISVEWLVKLSKALGVSIGDLLEEPGRPAVRMVPVVGKIAAGNWREAVAHTDEMMPVPGVGEACFALRPEGDSMNEIFADDAYVVIDPTQPDLLDGKIFAVMNGAGETTLKQYRADPPRLVPRSTNPEHQPIMFGREPFTVIGRVVFQATKM